MPASRSLTSIQPARKGKTDGLEATDGSARSAESSSSRLRAAHRVQRGEGRYDRGAVRRATLNINPMAFHSPRAMAQRAHHAVQRAANTVAMAGMAVGAAGMLAGARGVYETARPMLARTNPGLVRTVDTGLAAYDRIRGAM